VELLVGGEALDCCLAVLLGGEGVATGGLHAVAEDLGVYCRLRG